MHWRTVLHGGPITIIGLVYCHPSFTNGTGIETSPIAMCDPITGVVTTESGSQYRLATHALISPGERNKAMAALAAILEDDRFATCSSD